MNSENTCKNWERVPIKDIYLDLYDGPHATPKPSLTGPIFLGIKNLTEDGKLDLSEIRHIAEEDFPAWTRRVVPKFGDVVFTYEATLNRYAIIPKNFRGCLGRRLALIRPNPNKINSRFLFYYFFGADWQNTISKNILSGSTVDRIPLVQFPSFEISVPQLTTQHKIAAILSAYDDLIKNNTRRIAILEEMAQSIYQEWFVNFRYPGHEKNKMVKSESGMIPEGWHMENLSQLVNTQYGYTESASGIEVGPKFLRGMDINKTSYIQWDSVPYCTIDEKNYMQYKLIPGDIIIIRMADPGKVGIVEKDISAVFASYLIRLQIKKTTISSYYLFHFLKSEAYQSYITNASTGTTRKSASAGVITDIKLVIPPKDILRTFERNISLLRNTLNNLIDKNTNLYRTRDLLLPKLISGEIDVEDLDIAIPDPIEPAEPEELSFTEPEAIEAMQLALFP